MRYCADSKKGVLPHYCQVVVKVPVPPIASVDTLVGVPYYCWVEVGVNTTH